jgi:hypothetical protein
MESMIRDEARIFFSVFVFRVPKRGAYLEAGPWTWTFLNTQQSRAGGRRIVE